MPNIFSFVFDVVVVVVVVVIIIIIIIIIIMVIIKLTVTIIIKIIVAVTLSFHHYLFVQICSAHKLRCQVQLAEMTESLAQTWKSRSLE